MLNSDVARSESLGSWWPQKADVLRFSACKGGRGFLTKTIVALFYKIILIYAQFNAEMGSCELSLSLSVGLPTKPLAAMSTRALWAADRVPFGRVLSLTFT